MDNLLKSDHALEGLLEVQSSGEGFRAYAFTFSGCLVEA